MKGKGSASGPGNGSGDVGDPIQAAAEVLRNAYRQGAVGPLRQYLDPVDADAAYAVQEANTRRWIGEGRRVVGRKIGLTAKAVQVQLGVDQPDFGVLFEDMQLKNGGVLGEGDVIAPKAEAEVALVLARELMSLEADAEMVADAVAYVSPAIEIVDSRIADWKITFADTVADNGSSGYFVLGPDKKPLSAADLLTCEMTLTVNGQVTSTGSGAACLGHPLNAAAWLVRTLSARGASLRVGDIILTGALGPMTAIQPGDRVAADITGLGGVCFSYGRGANG